VAETETFEITVKGDRLAFAAAHFLVYGGGQCEALHGHNYRVSITLRGSLDANGLLVDFLAVRGAAEELLAPLDHRTLLAGENARLALEREGDAVSVRHAGRPMTLPASDVVVLPVENTSAELMAAYLARELADRLDPEAGGTLERITVEVEESDGLAGRCRLELGD